MLTRPIAGPLGVSPSPTAMLAFLVTLWAGPVVGTLVCVECDPLRTTGGCPACAPHTAAQVFVDGTPALIERCVANNCWGANACLVRGHDCQVDAVLYPSPYHCPLRDPPTFIPTPEPSPVLTSALSPQPTPYLTPLSTPDASPFPSPLQTPLVTEFSPVATPAKSPIPTPIPTPLSTYTPLPQTPCLTPLRTPMVSPAGSPQTTPVATPQVTPLSSPVVSPQPTPLPSPDPTPEHSPARTPAPTPLVSPQASPVVTPLPSPGPSPVVTPLPTPLSSLQLIAPTLKRTPLSTPDPTGLPTPRATPGGTDLLTPLASPLRSPASSPAPTALRSPHQTPDKTATPAQERDIWCGLPDIVRVCPAPNLLLQVRFTDTNAMAVCGGSPYGSVCTHKCQPGFRAHPPVTLWHCDDGDWHLGPSQALPECELSTSIPTQTGCTAVPPSVDNDDPPEMSRCNPAPSLGTCPQQCGLGYGPSPRDAAFTCTPMLCGVPYTTNLPDSPSVCHLWDTPTWFCGVVTVVLTPYVSSFPSPYPTLASTPLGTPGATPFTLLSSPASTPHGTPAHTPQPSHAFTTTPIPLIPTYTWTHVEVRCSGNIETPCGNLQRDFTVLQEASGNVSIAVDTTLNGAMLFVSALPLESDQTLDENLLNGPMCSFSVQDASSLVINGASTECLGTLDSPCQLGGVDASGIVSITVTLQDIVGLLDDTSQLSIYLQRAFPNPITTQDLKWISSAACKIDIPVTFTCSQSDCIIVNVIVCTHFAGIDEQGHGVQTIECKVPPSIIVQQSTHDSPALTELSLQLRDAAQLIYVYQTPLPIPPDTRFSGITAITADICRDTSVCTTSSLIHSAPYNLSSASVSVEPITMPVQVTFVAATVADEAPLFPVFPPGTPALLRYEIAYGEIVPEYVDAYLKLTTTVGSSNTHELVDLVTEWRRQLPDGTFVEGESGDCYHWDAFGHPAGVSVCPGVLEQIQPGDTMSFDISFRIRSIFLRKVLQGSSTSRTAVLTEDVKVHKLQSELPDQQDIEMQFVLQYQGADTVIDINVGTVEASDDNKIMGLSSTAWIGITVAVVFFAAAILLFFVIRWWYQRRKEGTVFWATSPLPPLPNESRPSSPFSPKTVEMVDGTTEQVRPATALEATERPGTALASSKKKLLPLKSPLKSPLNPILSARKKPASKFGPSATPGIPTDRMPDNTLPVVPSVLDIGRDTSMEMDTNMDMASGSEVFVPFSAQALLTSIHNQTSPTQSAHLSGPYSPVHKFKARRKSVLVTELDI
eukprot:gene5157-922_t